MRLKLGPNLTLAVRPMVMKPNNCIHGPQTWPWWRPFGWAYVNLPICKPSTGDRVWIYTRWWAFNVDICWDRRSL